MQVFQYLLWVGGVLICLMFALDVYIPAAPPREQHDIDRTTIRITAAPDRGIAPDTGDMAVVEPLKSDERDVSGAKPSPVTQAARLEPGQTLHKRKTRRASPKLVEKPDTHMAAQSNWSWSPWPQSNWSSSRSFNWSYDQSSRKPPAKASRSGAMRQPSGERNGYRSASGSNSNWW